MKRFLPVLAMVLSLGLSTLAFDAEAAKRMGAGKSMGTQRQATTDKAPAAAAPAAAPGAGTAATSRSWMGPLAGIAAGLGIAALASHLGFGDELASMVMMGLLAAAIMVAIGFFMRKRAAGRQSGPAAPAGLQYAHVNPLNAGGAPQNQNQAQAYKVLMPAAGANALGSSAGYGIGSNLHGNSSAATRIPADFDTAAFERIAKVNFIRLQTAHDAGNLDDIRQFTTPEMFAEIKLELANRGATTQKTDVLSIDAKVIDVDEDADRYLVSVRFIGVIRDDAGEQDEPFDEVWHLMKPRQGNAGWTLAGIQQTE